MYYICSLYKNWYYLLCSILFQNKAANKKEGGCGEGEGGKKKNF